MGLEQLLLSELLGHLSKYGSFGEKIPFVGVWRQVYSLNVHIVVGVGAIT
jgi:hypothetical protein